MRCAVACFLILVLPGTLCAFWPVYWELDGQKHVLGPLISYDNNKGETHLTVRPLLASYDSPRTYSFLWPLGRSTEEKSYFVPFYMRHSSGDGRRDWAFFPFFYGTTGKRSYGGVFPFYGKLYDRFRRDEITFFLWPLFGQSTWNDTTRTDVLWPLLSSSTGHQEGFKLGPLYGQRKVGNERRSTYILWPIFLKDEKDLDTDNPKSSLWAAPFYMQTTSPNSSFYAVFWPFFSYLRVEDRVDVKAPWPFLYFTTGKEDRAVNFWPVYSHTISGKDETTNIMWPVYKTSVRYPGDKKWTETRILFMSKYIRDDRGVFLNAWPFFEYRRTKDKTAAFFPSIFPWRNENFDRILRPLLTLYEYRREEDKVISNLLYGLYTKEQGPETWRRRFAFLFEVKREPEGHGFELLSGLFGVDPRRVKILYIPIKRGD